VDAPIEEEMSMLKTWSIGFVVLLTAYAASAAPQRTELDVADPSGALVAKIVVCNDCKNGKATATEPCDFGASDGWRDGKPCGTCFLQANWGLPIEYAYDLHVAGKLVDAKGEPVVGRFVKMAMPNGWSVRTRTLDDGTFRMMLGATLERKDTKPITAEIGTWVDSIAGEDPHFALYLLPVDYKACTSATPMPQAPAIDSLGL